MRSILCSLVVFLLLPTLLFAFGGKGEGKPVTFEVIESATQGGSSEPLNMIAKTEKDFKYIWDLTHRTIEPKPPMPAVDFTKEMVACLMMGERTSSGYSVKVSNIVEHKDKIVAHVVHTEGGGMLTVMTYPYEIIRMPRTNKQIVFEKVVEE